MNPNPDQQPGSDVVSNAEQAPRSEMLHSNAAQANPFSEIVREVLEAQRNGLIGLPPKSSGGRIASLGLMLITVVLVLFGIWLVLSGIVTCVRTNAWPSVEGTITHSAVQRVGKNTIAVVMYRYVVDGQHHDGDRLIAKGDARFLLRPMQEVVDEFPKDAKVSVYYDPRAPRLSVLIPGVPRGLWLAAGLLGIVTGICGGGLVVVLRASTRKPTNQPHANLMEKSFVERGGQFTLGVFCLVAAAFDSCLMFRMIAQHWQQPWGIEKVFVFVMGVIFIGIFGVIGWLGFKLLASAVRPAPQLAELELDPETPPYSKNSLVCIGESLNEFIAVIVDGDAAMIHFKNCHAAKSFIPRSAPWFSCPLSNLTALQTMKSQAGTVLRITTTIGSAGVARLTSKEALLLLLTKLIALRETAASPKQPLQTQIR